MRTLFKYLPLVALLTACGGDELEKKKAELDALRKEEVTITLKIKELEKEIVALGGGETARKLLLVDTSRIRLAPFMHFVEVYGVVDSDNNVQVSAETPGNIESIKVTKGQQVSRGQVLAVLNTEVISQNISEVQTGLELANTLYQKQERLWKQNIGTELQYLEAKNRKESLEKKLSSLKAQLALAYVKAPVDGVIDDIFLKKGEMASPGLPILRVVNKKDALISADVSETYINAVKKGDKVTLILPSLEKEVFGTVTSVGQYINPGNRTFKLYIKPEAGSVSLVPNMLARVRITDFADAKAITVPSDIIQFDLQGSYVFVAKEDKGEIMAIKKYVETGPSQDDKTFIESGLAEGELVVVKGHKALTDGEKVRVK